MIYMKNARNIRASWIGGSHGLIFLDVTPCSLVELWRRFGGTNSLDLLALLVGCFFLVDWLILRPRKRKKHVAPKRLQTSSRLYVYSITFQKIRLFNNRALFVLLSGVRLSPLGTEATTGLLYQPQMIDDGDCGAIGGMKIGRGNRSTGRNPPQRHFVHHKSHMTRPGIEPGPPRNTALKANSTIHFKYI
jgi:hypothetical protein